MEGFGVKVRLRVESNWSIFVFFAVFLCFFFFFCELLGGISLLFIKVVFLLFFGISVLGFWRGFVIPLDLLCVGLFKGDCTVGSFL